MGKLTSHVSMLDLARKAANAGHILASEHLLQVSRELVPIEEGTLSRSGETSVDEASMTANTTYSGPYAAYQHEMLNLRHDPGRVAKYLESPSISEATTFATIMAKAAKEAMS